MNLSDEQKSVVQATESKIAVIGPPGTGKTRVLTERIKWLLLNGVAPKDIVAITFTNFAANEMRARLPECSGTFIGTMHSYAAQLLIKNGVHLDMGRIVKSGDFSEIIYKANETNFKMSPIKYLFVDEVQDLCDYEYTFINKLQYENLFLGGDADQCIYQFKGARPNLFIDYCQDPTVKTYILTHNYRSGQNIIDFAEYFVSGIQGRIDVKVTGNLTNRGWVDRPEYEEALVELYQSKDYSNWFVLTRTNAELEAMARVLTSNGIPYVSFKQGDATNEEIQQFLRMDAVKLLTIHSAKGLEADNVIVVGAKNWSMEERCIEYVAATRARHKLYWCHGFSAGRKPTRKKPTQKKKPVVQGIRWE